MPYHVGGKGTNGCKGYPVVKEGGEVVGCHPTRAKADAQLQALYANVPDAEKSAVAGATPSFTVEPRYPGVGIKRPQSATTRGTLRGNAKTPKHKTRRGRSGDGLNNDGVVGSGGPGGSIG